LAVYDKAVEYISGGSNVSEIRAFFWKWKRSHQPWTESSLDRGSYNLTKPDEIAMQSLGVFGEVVAAGKVPPMMMMGGGMRLRRGMVGGMGGMGMAPAAAAPMARGGMMEGLQVGRGAVAEGAKFEQSFDAQGRAEGPEEPARIQPVV